MGSHFLLREGDREIRSVLAKVNQNYRDLAIVGFPLLCFSRQQEGNPKNTTDSEKLQEIMKIL